MITWCIVFSVCLLLVYRMTIGKRPVCVLSTNRRVCTAISIGSCVFPYSVLCIHSGMTVISSVTWVGPFLCSVSRPRVRLPYPWTREFSIRDQYNKIGFNNWNLLCGYVLKLRGITVQCLVSGRQNGEICVAEVIQVESFYVLWRHWPYSLYRGGLTGQLQIPLSNI